MLFSQRHGLKPIKKIIQIDFIDEDLRNALWNYLWLVYLELLKKNHTVVVYARRSLTGKGEIFIVSLWVNYFKKPADTIIDDTYDVIYERIRDYFFSAPWYEVYDFIEFFAATYPDKEVNKRFIKMCNSVLESELSGYRFVRGKITQITSEEEISAIEKALDIPDSFKGPRMQIKSALDKLSNRKSPDYRGSIKDSISAVEGVVAIITGEPKATLGKALKKIEDKSKASLHPALKEAFIKLYGYTSNAEGIRHALLDKPNLTFIDAEFMLVSCSAFINYLIDKTK